MLINTGHTILHELTHLDSLAAQAGLEPSEDGEDKGLHGTLDVQVKPELSGARDWLEKYEKDPEDTRPDYNAESYAAAATGESPVSSQVCNTPIAHAFRRILFHEPMQLQRDQSSCASRKNLRFFVDRACDKCVDCGELYIFLAHVAYYAHTIGFAVRILQRNLKTMESLIGESR